MYNFILFVQNKIFHKINHSVYFILIINFLYSCGKVQPLVPEPVVGNTPYDLQIPSNPYFGKFDIPSDNPLTEQGVELGRMLFYEKMLSADNTMSCASCHIQEFAFTDGKAVSTGIDGISGNKSSMPVFNMLWENVFFWDGRTKTLEEQALQPIENPIELHQSLDDAVKKLQESDIYPIKFKTAFGSEIITADNIAKAISQFERAITSYNSKYDKFLRGEEQFTEQELRGLSLMQHAWLGNIRGGNCSDCHFAPLFNGRGDLRNNGLDSIIQDIGHQAISGKPEDKGKFKVPTLRNLKFTAPYMHDGRFETLREVIDHYNKYGLRFHENVDVNIQISFNNPDSTSLGLTEQEIEDILAFLETLNDYTLIENPNFSDPFEK